jgi:hypothetical protein
MTAAKDIATVLLVLMAGPTAIGQELPVLPVNVFLPSGQSATSLTVTNQAYSCLQALQNTFFQETAL